MPHHHGSVPLESIPPQSKYYDRGRFGRMFGKLPPFSSDTPEVRAALRQIGRRHGIMDADDELAAGPLQLLTDPNLSKVNRNSTTHVAGDTFLGQFIDHDITFDPTSSLSRQVDPEQVSNFRVPSLGLDNIYGSGPTASPHLYDRNKRGIAMLIESTGAPYDRPDVPRNSQDVALIGDPRNDENLILSQFHTAMLSFHNAVLEYVRIELKIKDPGIAFAEAQRIVRWHYQWIVVHDFLRKTCGSEVIDDILVHGRKFYSWHNEPFIPVEFSVAAFRFGHSQVRPSYGANLTSNGGAPFFGMIFTKDSLPVEDPDDLSGGVRAPRRFVDWPTFFDFKDGKVGVNKKIDTKLSSALFELPGSVVSHPNAASNPASLAARNLLRHVTFSLPSGQRVARAMCVPELAAGDLKDLEEYGLDDRTPLWFYILREADVMHDGERLGPVGGRIVAEVLIGLLQGDRTSYLSQDPDWQPFLPTIDPTNKHNDFGVPDLLRFAHVA